MEQTLNHGMCRCCASEGMFKNFSATYQWMGADEVYADMLKECFDISLTTADDWNNGGICEVCITQLRNASNFRKQVLQTEDQFKKALQDKLYKDSIVKVEVNRDEDDLDSDNNVSDFSGTGELEFEVPVKEELEETKTKKRTAKATTSRAKKAKTEDGEPSSKRSRHHVDVIELEKYSRRANKKSLRIITINREETETKFVDTLKRITPMYKQLTNLKEIVLCSNATLIKSKTDFGYECCFCDEKYQVPSDLKEHCLDNHKGIEGAKFMNRAFENSFLVKLDITDLRCNICYNSIDTLEDLIEHLHETHKRKMFVGIKNQMIPFKFDSSNLQCCICFKGFNKFKMLHEHMHSHYRHYTCKECDAGFINRNTLRIHMHTHKLGIFQCQFCAKIFDTYIKKHSHERCVHNDAILLNKCGYCNERFRDSRQKDKHLAEIHGVKLPPSVCLACNRQFGSQNSLKMHMKREHLLERKFSCTECDKRFFVKTELSRHMVKHTGTREFECVICGKSYGRQNTLREHMRIHANDRRYKCRICGMAFVQKCSWRHHMRAKHGETV